MNTSNFQIEAPESARLEESERAFRRFEPVLRDFLEAYKLGGGITVDTVPLVSSTYSVRLRDAIRGTLRHNYKSDMAPAQAIRAAWESSIVKPVAKFQVYIGPQKPKAVNPFKGASTLTRDMNVFSVSSVEQVSGLILLCKTNASTPMNKLIILDNHEDIRAYLDSNTGEDTYARWEDLNTVILA
jgi:hypothetical protein